MKEDLSRPFLYSTLAHLILVLFFTVKAVFLPEVEDTFQPAIKVEIVDLPDKIVSPPEELKPPAEEKKAELPPPAPKAPPPPTPKTKEPEPEVVLNPKKEDKKSKKETTEEKASDAIEKIKKKMAIEKIKEELKEKERQELSQRVHQYKGQVLAPGTEISGVVKLQYENYLGQLDQHVKKFWSLPEWLAQGDYKAQVKIFLDAQGLLIKVQLVSGSGNAQYDDEVIETVKKAVPYPIPPEKFRDIVGVKGMILGFPE